MQYQGQIKGRSKRDQREIKEGSKDVLARSRAFGAGHLRRAKRGEERKREEAQIGPRRDRRPRWRNRPQGRRPPRPRNRAAECQRRAIRSVQQARRIRDSNENQCASVSPLVSDCRFGRLNGRSIREAKIGSVESAGGVGRTSRGRMRPVSARSDRWRSEGAYVARVVKGSAARAAIVCSSCSLFGH